MGLLLWALAIFDIIVTRNRVFWPGSEATDIGLQVARRDRTTSERRNVASSQ